MTAAETAAATPRRILAITSRASDFVELAELVVELARRGHHMRLLHLYPENARVYHESTFAAIEALKERHPGIEARAVSVESIGAPRAVAAAAAAAAAAKAQAGAKKKAPWRQRLLQWLIASGTRARKSLMTSRAYMRIPQRWRDRIDSEVVNLVRLFTFVLYPGILPARAVRRFTPAQVKQLLMAVPMIRYYRRFYRFFTAEVRSSRLDALLMPEDVVGYMWPLAIKAGHDCGIPSLVFPYTLANREEPIRSLAQEPLFQTRNFPPLARMFSRWRWRDGNVDLMRMPFEHVYAHELLRITPPDPWMMNSGYANRVCVDSRASYDYFAAGGIPQSKLEVTGSASQDRMHELKERKAATLAELRRALGLRGEKPLLLVSGCPEQLAGPVPGCEFRTMAEIGAFVGRCLQPLGEHYHLVVRAHPNYPQFGAMLEPFGFVDTATPTAQLVPAADLFVAFASSTIRWAISCAVPTVNYDVFHYGYGDFALAAGVLSVQEKDDFRAAVASLEPGSHAYAGLAAKIAADSARWSMMDGHCVDRIEATIQRECAQHPAPRTSH